MSSSFHDQLVATRDRKHSKNHPFFELWAQGKLTKEQTAFYCTHHYHFVGEFLNWLAYQGSQIRERDVKNYLFENLGDEENPDDRHLDMLKDYVAASGVNRDTVESSIVLAATEGLQNWGWRMVYQRPWQGALAGMFIGLESPNVESLIETNKPQNYRTDLVADVNKVHSYGIVVQGGVIV